MGITAVVSLSHILFHPQRVGFLAAQFAAHAQMYQAVSAQAAAIHDMFVTSPAASADSYVATEAASAIAAS